MTRTETAVCAGQDMLKKTWIKGIGIHQTPNGSTTSKIDQNENSTALVESVWHVRRNGNRTGMETKKKSSSQKVARNEAAKRTKIRGYLQP